VATRISTPARRTFGLRLDGHATVNDRRPKRHGSAVRPHGLVDLHGELARWDEDERPNRVARRRKARVGVLTEAVEDRKREGGGLARAGLRRR
jgi:hypothetical protein